MAEFVRAARAGDRDAFGHIVQMFESRLFRLVLVIIRDPSAAEDVSQEAFIRAYTRLDSFDENRPFYPWLATIGVRLSQNWLKAHQRRRRDEGISLERGSERDEMAWALHKLMADERRRLLWHAVSTLPVAERTVVTLHYQDGLDVRTVGKTLTVTVGTVKTLLFRARRHLRARLTPAIVERGRILMTCERVRALIDGNDSAGVSASDRAAAVEHVRQCAGCTAALVFARDLKTNLSAIQVEPPRSCGTVMSRIASLDAPPAGSDSRRPNDESLRWGLAVLSMVTGLVLAAVPLWTSQILDLGSRKFGHVTLLLGATTSRRALGLAFGVLLYCAGVFLPRNTSRNSGYLR